MLLGGSGLKELFSTIYAEDSIKKMISGHSYARNVRAHFMAHVASSSEVDESILLTEEDERILDFAIAIVDSSTMLNFKNNELFQALKTSNGRQPNCGYNTFEWFH